MEPVAALRGETCELGSSSDSLSTCVPCPPLLFNDGHSLGLDMEPKACLMEGKPAIELILLRYTL